MIELPIACVTLDAPVFKGQVEVCLIASPGSDVILGRTPGVRFQCIKGDDSRRHDQAVQTDHRVRREKSSQVEQPKGERSEQGGRNVCAEG